MLALMRMLLCTYVSLGALLCACQANFGISWDLREPVCLLFIYA